MGGNLVSCIMERKDHGFKTRLLLYSFAKEIVAMKEQLTAVSNKCLKGISLLLRSYLGLTPKE